MTDTELLKAWADDLDTNLRTYIGAPPPRRTTRQRLHLIAATLTVILGLELMILMAVLSP